MSVHADFGWYKGESWALGITVAEVYPKLNSLYLFYGMFLKFRASIEITW